MDRASLTGNLAIIRRKFVTQSTVKGPMQMRVSAHGASYVLFLWLGEGIGPFRRTHTTFRWCRLKLGRQHHYPYHYPHPNSGHRRRPHPKARKRSDKLRVPVGYNIPLFMRGRAPIDA
eukprot:scaffold45181_cov25-Attheya_sp.AAC.1